MTTRVFIVNEPLKKDDATGEYARFLPMESASDFGTVIKLTPDGSPAANPAVWMKLIREGLDAWDDGDYIVLVGDQAMLAYAASVVGEWIGECEAANADPSEIPVLRFLKWERRLQAYSPLTLRESAITNA